MRESFPGERGALGITIAALATTTVICLQTGTLLPLILCTGGLIVGWQAVRVINRK